ncbi:MAG: hypothetical protein ACTSR8_06160 [Promethearchaeota archaeon]
MERLYQPDFSCIFGKKFANAFAYGQVDSLVWPIFTDIEKSDRLQNLLKLKNKENREVFYTRKLSISDEKNELECANISYALIQGMELDRSYGISNSDVISVVSKDSEVFKAILSFSLLQNKEELPELKKIEKQITVVGIAIYPSYTKLALTSNNNENLNSMLNYCKEKGLVIKIDIGNLFIPDNNAEYISYENLKTFISRFPDNLFIISGLDISGDFHIYYQLLKYSNNVWIEIDPRSFGGMTPTNCFLKIFNIQGLVQNAWSRMLIGSATPTLEMTQMVRGFLEATEQLPFAQKCILNSWVLRNINRINSDIFNPIKDPKIETILDIKKEKIIENDCEINLIYKVTMRSYSITQLLFLTDILKDLFNKTINEYPSCNSGELFLRSYHTTSSLFINEHEYGNYLDLHYGFAELSKKDSSFFLHTVRALENRADFNHFDHELASTYGSRQLILPIIDQKLEIGGRENFYVLVTFGPRTFKLFLKFKLLKQKKK